MCGAVFPGNLRPALPPDRGRATLCTLSDARSAALANITRKAAKLDRGTHKRGATVHQSQAESVYLAAVALIQEAVDLLSEVIPIDKAGAVACKIAADYSVSPDRETGDQPTYISGSVH